jgi:hypothetical protein
VIENKKASESVLKPNKPLLFHVLVVNPPNIFP